MFISFLHLYFAFFSKYSYCLLCVTIVFIVVNIQLVFKYVSRILHKINVAMADKLGVALPGYFCRTRLGIYCCINAVSSLLIFFFIITPEPILKHLVFVR